MADKKNIVIVGAGFAGIYAAKRLSAKLRNKKDYQIVLIDKNSYMTYQTEIHEVATERVTHNHVQEDLEMLFHKSNNVKIVTAYVNKIEPSDNIVKTSVGDIKFEELLIAIGGETNDFGTPGVKENGFTLWSLEEAMQLKEHIRSTIQKGSIETDPKLKEELMTISVVGSGFTGVELIGELIQQRQVLSKEFNFEPSEMKLNLIEATPSILNMLKDRKLADKAEDYMSGNGINILKNSQVIEVNEDNIKFKDGNKISTRTLVWTAGVKAKDTIQNFGLEYESGRGGRVKVNENMKIGNYDNIYGAGDIIEWVDPKSGPTPQTVEGGESMAATAYKNIVNSIQGKETNVPFKRIDHGFAVSVGSEYTVASLFNFINISGFIATLAKHGINLYYFTQILSLGSIWKYLTNEFFRMKNDREPTNGIISRQGNTLWSLPLRILVAFIWIISASSGLDQFSFIPNSGFLAFISTLIGIFILFGFFTNITLIFSMIMLLFLPSLGFGLIKTLLIFVSFSLLSGSGRNLGVDKWLQPFIQKHLGKLWYGQSKTHYNEIKEKK